MENFEIASIFTFHQRKPCDIWAEIWIKSSAVCPVAQRELPVHFCAPPSFFFSSALFQPSPAMRQTSMGRHYKESRKQKTALPNTTGNQKQRRSIFENVPTHIRLLWHVGDPDAKGLMRKAWWEKQAVAFKGTITVTASSGRMFSRIDSTLLTLIC